MHIEEEAKKKWCPMVRRLYVFRGIRNTTVTSYNITEDGGWLERCVASACMMWKWYDADYHQWKDGIPNNARGYCGLTE